MPSIEDFTAPLWTGTREIFVPKEKVTELSSGWYKSTYNLPHKGSVGAWRNGRLHAHDMGDHWAVHLDRVDPQMHSMGHLIADAPLLLFLWSGFLNSMLMAKEGLESSIGLIPGTNYCLTRMDKLRLVGGLALVFVGTWVIIDPDLELVTFLFLIPIMIIILGSMMVFDGVAGREGGRISKAAGGLALVGFGSIGILVEELVLLLLLLFLMFWTLASGIYLLLLREEKMDHLRDRVAPIVLGGLSLGLGVFMLLDIDSAVYMLLRVIGLLGIVAGSMQVLYGSCAWNRSKA
ncbi:MAG: hypothetical protein A4E32_00205 [Methanomassiliicoccales archaeon PtaU1.Bin124]|nr:MAG: hypothetical protein A4E32_00205 [Methanomassiliicoccales archaeon PtaU1.Bin124]